MIVTTKHTEFEEMPTGRIAARLYDVYDLGLQPNPHEAKPKRECVLLFELNARKKTGEPFYITKKVTASMNKKANLRILLETWRGVPFEDKDVETFDTKKICGKFCYLTIAEKKRTGPGIEKTNFEIIKIERTSKDFSFDSALPEGFIPDWIKRAVDNQIIEAPEDINPDEIPF
ncbi:hypothetical protein K7I13_12045 [Brucepastera parasyntrophica]|uniref:phage replication initiation protein, NGO0469 family n=1 Tax=Brucepastera parasyntrophica TaxID=2880008 RepID=UPI002109C227|nr:hypothetical protein [Brucepastera parasyntrophica]ULQ59218.1 hypothetical protein K7I13_12045 [Brucepastera parasyntrophica]